MFKNLLKKMDEMKTSGISIPVETDAKGYFDRECPDQKCLFQFKVNEKDWQNLFKDEAVYCPMCRHEAPSQSWWTKEQLENANQQALDYLTGEISGAMKKDAQVFNRRQSGNSFLKISMSVTGSSRIHILMPIPAQDEMEQEIQCESCNARYAVIGCAFFCPCCGYNSIEKTFEDAIKKVGVKIDNLGFLKKMFKEDGRVDEGEITCLSLMETSLSELVVAFQRYSEERYKSFTGLANIPFNAFQRLDTGSGLWEAAIGEGYGNWLTGLELQELIILFQKRHLLAHREGIVDDKYILKSHDHAYRIGQRIVIGEKDIKDLISLLQKIVMNIKRKTGELGSHT